MKNTNKIFQFPSMMPSKELSEIAAVPMDIAKEVNCADSLLFCMQQRLEMLLQDEILSEAIQTAEQVLKYDSTAESKAELVQEIMASDQMAVVVAELRENCCTIEEYEYDEYRLDTSLYDCKCTEEEFNEENYYTYLEKVQSYFQL